MIPEGHNIGLGNGWSHQVSLSKWNGSGACLGPALDLEPHVTLQGVAGHLSMPD